VPYYLYPQLNRGVWEQANVLDNFNAIMPQRLASFGLTVNTATDQARLI
jgi:hypothetical protein